MIQIKNKQHAFSLWCQSRDEPIQGWAQFETWERGYISIKGTVILESACTFGYNINFYILLDIFYLGMKILPEKYDIKGS